MEIHGKEGKLFINGANYKKVKCPDCGDELILKSKNIGSEIRAEGFCYNCGYRWVDSIYG